MKFKEAKKQFQYALDHQKTISINKLKKLMQSMNMNLETSRDREVEYLKREIKNLHRHIKKINKDKENKQ